MAGEDGPRFQDSILDQLGHAPTTERHHPLLEGIVPDFLGGGNADNPMILMETKNASYVSNSTQLQREMALAKQATLPFQLFVPGSEAP